MTSSRISHRDLAGTLVRIRAGVSASDLHGSLVGFLCAGGKTTAEAWPSALELDAGHAGELLDDTFALLYRHCREQLDDSELGFEPLLPGDDVALTERAEALVEWCRGFLGGVGLASSTQSAGELSVDAREIVQDFSTIAASSFDYGDDEEDETALNEVLEFVRVGVLLLYSELAPVSPHSSNMATASRRLH